MLVYGLGALVLGTCVLFAAGPWLSPEREVGFAPTANARAHADGTFTITVDVSEAGREVELDLLRGTIAPLGQPGHLRLQRHLITSRRTALDLGAVLLSQAEIAPERLSSSGTNNSPNPLAHWYQYSYWTHRLRSLDHTYAIGIDDERIAYAKILSYYCNTGTAGCLTLRYRLATITAQ